MSNLCYTMNQTNYNKIPGSPIAYWVSESIILDFQNATSLSDCCDTKKGLATSNNNVFLRLWFETSLDKIGFNFSSNDETINCKEKWFPINKGGDFRRWYGNREYVINWENNGYEIKNYKDENGQLKSRPQNLQYNFKQANTWSKITSGTYSSRFCEGGFLFDDAAAICHHEDSAKLKYVLGFLNTKCCQEFLDILNPTLNVQIGDVGNLPVLNTEENPCSLVDENIQLSKTDWDSFETSWDFKKHPLI